MGWNNYDRLKETTTTTGTGTITLLGAVTGFATFASRMATGDSFVYCINLSGEWEVGEGTLVSSSTMSRDRVVSSSNSDALVSFSAGTKEVFLTLPAHAVIDHGAVLALSNGTALN